MAHEEDLLLARRLAETGALGKDQIDRCLTIVDQRAVLGMRKPPAVPFLSRSNPINKYIGKLLDGRRKDAKPRAGR